MFTLLFRLNPFGNDIQIKAMSHRNDGAYNCPVASIDGNITNKRLINFQLIERQAFEILQ